MTKFTSFRFVSVCLGLLFLPVCTFAHQPVLFTDTELLVTNPELSQAFYATLDGVPHVYHINEAEPFVLYVNILVPDIAGQKTDVVAEVYAGGATGTPLVVLGGTGDTWKKMWEPFGYDAYLTGAELRNEFASGAYDIRVSSPTNTSKYVLAIGEKEQFGIGEIFQTLRVVPQLKRNFFGESPLNFVRSPIGFLSVLFFLGVGVVFGLGYRLMLRRRARIILRTTDRESWVNRAQKHNIGLPDRFLRFGIANALLWYALTTSWHPFLFIASGFTFLEVFAGWCGFYALLGKRTCPIDER